MDFPVTRNDLNENEMIYGGRYVPFVYVLKCIGKRFYIGWTTNLSKRLYEHLHSKNAAYFTFKYEPVRLHCLLMVPTDVTAQEYERDVYEHYKKDYPDYEVSMGQYEKYVDGQDLMEFTTQESCDSYDDDCESYYSQVSDFV